MITKVLAGIISLLALALSVAIAWGSIESHQVQGYKAAAKTYQAAQKTNLDTIAALQASNQQWAEKDRADMLLSKAYSDAQVEYSNQLQVKLSKAQAALRGMYANSPAEKSWSAQPWPSDVAEQLRQSAGH